MKNRTISLTTFRTLLAFCFLAGLCLKLAAQQTIFVDDWGLVGDGVTDDQAALKKLFHTLKGRHGTNTVIFSPKTYYLGCNWTNTLIEIPSCCTALAYSMNFLFPTNLPIPKATEYQQQRILQDSGGINFRWRGGTPFHVLPCVEPRPRLMEWAHTYKAIWKARPRHKYLLLDRLTFYDC